MPDLCAEVNEDLQGRGRGPKDVIAVPMELLTIKRGQKRRGLLIGDQQANLVRKAAQRPDEKRQDISSWIGKASTMMGGVEKNFGLKVAKEPVTVDGRLLPAPVIEYGSPQHYYAGTTGAWNMIDVRCCSPNIVSDAWTLLPELMSHVRAPCGVVRELGQ
jgi:eukaryotic translation initiation factor 2C